MLLLHLHRLALRLQPVLPWCYGAGLAAAAAALFLVLREGASDELLALTLGLSVWALLLYAFARLFQTLPPPVLPHDRWFERVRARCVLAFYHLLALALIGVALTLAAMSLKLVTATLR